MREGGADASLRKQLGEGEGEDWENMKEHQNGQQLHWIQAADSDLWLSLYSLLLSQLVPLA